MFFHTCPWRKGTGSRALAQSCPLRRLAPRPTVIPHRHSHSRTKSDAPMSRWWKFVISLTSADEMLLTETDPASIRGRYRSFNLLYVLITFHKPQHLNRETCTICKYLIRCWMSLYKSIFSMQIYHVHKSVSFDLYKYVRCLYGPVCVCKWKSVSCNNPLSLSHLLGFPISDGEAVKFVCFSSLFDAVTFDRLRKFWPINCLQIRKPCTRSYNCAAGGTCSLPTRSSNPGSSSQTASRLRFVVTLTYVKKGYLSRQELGWLPRKVISSTLQRWQMWGVFNVASRNEALLTYIAVLRCCKEIMYYVR